MPHSFLTQKECSLAEITLPPTQTKKIATILSSVDRVIETTQAQINKLKALKTGLMQILLTQGIGHTQFKDSPVGRIPVGWEQSRMEKFAVLQRGFDLPVQNRIKGPFPIYGSNGIVGYHNESKIIGSGVVTGRSGSIGKVWFIEKDFWALNTSPYIKNFHGNDHKYVYYFLNYFNLSRFSSGTGVPTLNRNDVHLISISYPPYPNKKKLPPYSHPLIIGWNNNISLSKKHKV